MARGEGYQGIQGVPGFVRPGKKDLAKFPGFTHLLRFSGKRHPGRPPRRGLQEVFHHTGISTRVIGKKYYRPGPPLMPEIRRDPGGRGGREN